MKGPPCTTPQRHCRLPKLHGALRHLQQSPQDGLHAQVHHGHLANQADVLQASFGRVEEWLSIVHLSVFESHLGHAPAGVHAYSVT